MSHAVNGVRFNPSSYSYGAAAPVTPAMVASPVKVSTATAKTPTTPTVKTVTPTVTAHLPTVSTTPVAVKPVAAPVIVPGVTTAIPVASPAPATEPSSASWLPVPATPSTYPSVSPLPSPVLPVAAPPSVAVPVEAEEMENGEDEGWPTWQVALVVVTGVAVAGGVTYFVWKRMHR